MTKRPALGKGLSALIGQTKTSPAPTPAPAPRIEPKEKADAGRRVVEIDPDKIVPNRFQARRAFDEAGLQELAASIRESGILQPLVVRPIADKPGTFELIAGERRFRAARMAGLKTVPALTLAASDQEASVLSLVENLQREDLNPIDEAEGLRALIDHFQLTQEQAAQKVGKSRSAVANVLRLLTLPETVKSALASGRLSEGHARALLGLAGDEDILFAFNEVLARGLSVRETEALVARRTHAGRLPSRRAKKQEPREKSDPNVDSFLNDLSELYGTKITIAGTEAEGKVELHFFSKQDRDRLLEMLSEARK